MSPKWIYLMLNGLRNFNGIFFSNESKSHHNTQLLIRTIAICPVIIIECWPLFSLLKFNVENNENKSHTYIYTHKIKNKLQKPHKMRIDYCKPHHDVAFMQISRVFPNAMKSNVGKMQKSKWTSFELSEMFASLLKQ